MSSGLPPHDSTAARRPGVAGAEARHSSPGIPAAPVPAAPAPATSADWPALLERSDVVENCILGSTFGFMAFHGGLEVGTLEIARAAAEAVGASSYTVDQPVGLRWHVPSAQVDPDASEELRRFLDHVDVVVALHGYGRRNRPYDVLIGGGNRPLAALLAHALRAGCPDLVPIDDLDAIPPRLRGLHPANPANRPRGGGIQVELPVRGRMLNLNDHVAGALAETARRWEGRRSG